MPVNPSF